jgi:hypothetical protein
VCEHATRREGVLAFIAVCFSLHFGTAVAQAPVASGVLQPGSAAASGFSGPRSWAVTLPPGTSPIDKTYVDLDGPSVRIIDVSNMGGPPRGQAVNARKLTTIPARQIGQVFSVALDDSIPPNIYVAATSAYGLPIVVPDTDGDGLPDRTRVGRPGAQFMPGLFGPATAGGGPGSIWKIDGATGGTNLFANVTLDGVANSGPALGGLVFDPMTRQLFVSDRDTGLIHSFRLDATETGRFDHGEQALPTIGLPPIPFNSRKRLDIQNSVFDSVDPATWGYAPSPRRVFGLAVHRGRLFYAIASGLRIWSVSLNPDGSFGADPRVEMAIPSGTVPGSEISKIIFDDAGDMLLAERGAAIGTYDYGAMTAENSGRVLRLRSNPSGSPFRWVPVGEYPIGFLPNYQNADGGIALGYGYMPTGQMNSGACGGTLWTTGTQLRITADPAIGQRLAASGPLPIDGLQGNAVSLLRPQNVPPLSAYFIDYDDQTDRAGTPGQMGDVAVWRLCPSAPNLQISDIVPQFLDLALENIGCPPGTVRLRLQCTPTPCPPGESYRGGKCGKPQCPPSQNVGDGLCCPARTIWNPRTGTCEPPERGSPDLEIIKVTGRCSSGGGPCAFTIRVTNVGDVSYAGPITVGDIAMPGNVSNMSGPPGWSCGSAQVPGNLAPPGGTAMVCQNPSASIAPGASVNFTAIAVVGPSPRIRWENCAVVLGDPSKDSNLANNRSCVKGEEEPPQGASCPAGTILTIRGACCTPEAIATGNCRGVPPPPPRPTPTCEPPRFIINGACCTRADAASGVCGGSQIPPPPPLPTPTCEPPRFIINGACCTRADAASGVCGGSQIPPPPPLPTPTCEPPRLIINGACCTREDAASGVCGGSPTPPPAPLPTPTCEAPRFIFNGACCTREDAASGICGGSPTPPPITPLPPPSTTRCPFPTFSVNGRCCSREEMRTGVCGTAPPVANCPDGSARIGGRCPDGNVGTECSTKQYRGADGKCHDRPRTGENSCQSGFSWDGKRCVKDRAAERSRCKSGTHMSDGQCVSNKNAKPTTAKSRDARGNKPSSVRQRGVDPRSRQVTAPKPVAAPIQRIAPTGRGRR